MAKKPANSKKTKAPATEKTAETTKSSTSLFKRKKRAERPKKGPPLSNVFRLFIDSLDVLFSRWKLFGGILLVYIILLLVLAGAVNPGTDITELKDELEDEGESTQHVGTGIALFSVLLSSFGGGASEGGTAYQSIILIVVSLAIIWALRQVLAGKPATTRDAFYKGLYPLAQFTLVLLVIALQLIPLLLSAVILGSSFTGGTSISGLELSLWALLAFIMATLSLYMLCWSLFALYIVTLPDMRPWASLRSARELTRHRRWTIMRKLIFLPFALLVLAAIITVPLIIFAAPIAQWIFVLLSIMSIFVVHAYIYNLYRELL